MLEKGWIHPSVSPYGTSLLFVCKKTGKLRMCINYRAPNCQTKLDIFPTPRIADLIDHLGRACIFLSMDLVTAYHQICMKWGHEHCTDFVMPQGLYEWIVMPLVLINAPATFQCIMNLTFSDMLHKCVCVLGWHSGVQWDWATAPTQLARSARVVTSQKVPCQAT